MTGVSASFPIPLPTRWAHMISSSFQVALGRVPFNMTRHLPNGLRSAAPVKLKTSVCTGALLLGSAGFLVGKRATTHPTAFEELKPYCATVVVDHRVVDEEGVVTAQGVTSSIDLGLHLVERIAGREAKASIAKQMDYPYDELARSMSAGKQIPPSL